MHVLQRAPSCHGSVTRDNQTEKKHRWQNLASGGGVQMM